jgi:hypothetical protein
MYVYNAKAYHHFSSFLFFLTLLLVADTHKKVHQIESETDFVI